MHTMSLYVLQVCWLALQSRFHLERQKMSEYTELEMFQNTDLMLSCLSQAVTHTYLKFNHELFMVGDVGSKD